MINVEIDPQNVNKVYRPFMNDTTRTQIFFGGASSGKSVFAVGQRPIYDMMCGDRNYLVVRNSAKTHRNSTHNEMTKTINKWGLNQLFSYGTSATSDLTINCANGMQILFVGLDDVEKVKSVTPRKGVITDILMEEATEIHYDDFKQLAKRLRGKSKVPKRITMLFNPIMRTHWIHKEFFTYFNEAENAYRDPELSILRTTYKDNDFLEEEDGHFLEGEKNEYYYNVYTLGLWGVLGHLIFTNWRTEDLTGRRDAFGTYYNGLDFGFTNDPTAMSRMAIKGKTLYITHGLYEYGITNEPLSAKLLPIIGKEQIRCDPSNPHDRQELRVYGVNAIKANGGPGTKNHGIQYMQNFDEIVIHRELQPAINEFQLYQWEKNRDGEVTNTPVDKNDHFLDSCRYSLSSRSLKLPDRGHRPFNRAALGLPS